jgi:hypothetical protein
LGSGADGEQHQSKTAQGRSAAHDCRSCAGSAFLSPGIVSTAGYSSGGYVIKRTHKRSQSWLSDICFKSAAVANPATNSRTAGGALTVGAAAAAF